MGSAKLIGKVVPSGQAAGASQGCGAATPSMHHDPCGQRTIVVAFGQYQPLKHLASVQRSGGGGGIVPVAPLSFSETAQALSSSSCRGWSRNEPQNQPVGHGVDIAGQLLRAAQSTPCGQR